MAKRRQSDEQANEPDPQAATLSALVLAVYHGDIVIYDPVTGDRYSFDTYKEARDVVYSGNYLTTRTDTDGHQ